MEKILLAVDGSAPALRAARYAARLAQALGTVEVCVLNVQPPIYDWQMHGTTREAVARYHQETADRIIGAAIEALGASRDIGKPEYRHADDAAEMIVQVARERGATQLVMGTRGLGRVAGLALGSTATKVIHLTAAPVTLVK
jgi:nucleotide-binding universal stress UspA family protein